MIVGSDHRSWIQTSSGRLIDLSNFTMDDVDLNDIAHALSNINRYNGHSNVRISVAFHSFCVSRMVGQSFPSLALCALHHDSAEAYVGDISKWLKQHEDMEPFRLLEDHIQHTIMRKFGCQTGISGFIKKIDKMILQYEVAWAFENWHSPRHDYGALYDDEVRDIDAVVNRDINFSRNHKELFLEEHERLSQCVKI